MSSKEENIERELLARTEKLDKLIKENLELKTKESSADKMFEELGYDNKEENEEKIIYQDSGNEDINIVFHKKHKVITGMPTYDYFCDMEILQAINEKVKELRLVRKLGDKNERRRTK